MRVNAMADDILVAVVGALAVVQDVQVSAWLDLGEACPVEKGALAIANEQLLGAMVNLRAAA